MRVLWHEDDIFQMNVLPHRPILGSERALITMDFEDESRFGVRLLIWSPPPSLALSRISDDYLVAWAERLGAAESIDGFCSLRAGVL